MQTASQMAIEALWALREGVDEHWAELPEGKAALSLADAALAALSVDWPETEAELDRLILESPPGDEAESKARAERVLAACEPSVDGLIHSQRQLIDAQRNELARLRERINVLEGAIGKVLPELGAMERSPYLKHHATIVYCQSKLKDALPPAAPQ